MIKFIALKVLLLLPILLTACAIPSDITSNLNSIALGDSYSSVIGRLGNPRELLEKDGATVIGYCNYGWLVDESVGISFKNGNVIAIRRGPPCGPFASAGSPRSAGVSEAAPSSAPNNVCNCKGYDGVGGPCYGGVGGLAYSGVGGPAYAGVGGPCYAGVGGPEYDGVGGPRYDGVGGPAYDGVGGPAYDGVGGACYAGVGGPCYSGIGGTGASCPAVCK